MKARESGLNQTMKNLTSLFLLLALLFSTPGHALIIDANFVGVNAGGNTYRNIDGRGYTVSAGQMQFNINNLATALPNIGTNTLYGWCIEPFESVRYGRDYQWEIQDLSLGTTNIGGMGTQRANYLRELYYYVAPDFTQTVSPTVGLALQIATWEIVRDDALGNFDLASGNASFRRSNPSDAIALAQGWLNTYINDGVQGPMLNNLYAANINGVQDMIFQIKTTDRPNNEFLVPVPAPAWLLGLGALWLLRRRAQ